MTAFSVAILMSRRVNLRNYHDENLHRSLVLRDLLLDGDKTLKVLAILEYGFLWPHLKAKNSTWLITELANQRARKALFTCVVYMYTPRPRWKDFSESATSKKQIGIMNLKLFLYELFEWYSHANKIQLHKKAFAFSLVLKVRVFVTQKWPIAGKTAAHKEHHRKTFTHALGWAFPVKFKVTLSRQSLPCSASFSVLHAFCCSASSSVFDHFVVLKLLLWITRQRSLKYLVH